MSIFGSMTTAVLGLSAQSKALGHISDNIANASTVGYKRVNTAFETLVLQSNERLHAPGGVTAAPVFMNNIQGNLTQVQSPTNAAIQGQGFFSVSKLSRGLTGPGQQGETVQTQTGTLNADNVYYTRVGDFELDKNRYLVNSAGFALNGWIVDDVTGQLKKDVVQPLQVNTLTDKPQSTNSITLGANLPATPTPGVPIPSSSIQVYDTQGNARTIQFNWRQDAANAWRLGIDAPGSSSQPVAGSFTGGAASMAAGSQVSGVTPVAQVSQVLVNGTTSFPSSSVTVSGRTNYYPDGTSQDNIRVGDTYTLNINGSPPVTVTVTAANIASFSNFTDVANALASGVNAMVPAPYTAEIDSSDPRKVLVKKLDGTPVEVSGSFSNTKPQLSTVSGPSTNLTGSVSGDQRSTFTFSTAAIDVGDEFRITVAGKEFKTRVTSANIGTLVDVNGVVANLANQINTAVPSLNVNALIGTATVPAGTANQLVLDGTVATPTFTATYGVTNADSRDNNISASTPVDYQTATATITQAATAALPEITHVAFPSTAALKVPDQYVVNVLGVEFKTTVTYSNINTLKDMNGVVDDLVTQINSQGLAVTAMRNPASGALVLTGTPGAALGVSGSKLDITATDNVRVGDSYTVRVDGVPYAVSVTADNILTMGTYGGIANALAAQINSARPQAPVIASVVNSQLQVTARNPGTPFKIDQEYTSGAASNNQVNGPTISAPTDSRGQRQEFSYPQTQIDIGDVYSVSIDGTPISVKVDKSNYGNFQDINGVLQELANRVNATNLNVVATATGGRLTLTHNTSTTGKFEAKASIQNATGSSGTLTASTTTSNVAGVRQSESVTLTGTPGDKDAEYTVIVNGSPITYRTTGEETSMETIAASLANLVNKNTSLPVTASAEGSVLKLVAKSASGTVADQFTLETAAQAGTTPAHVLLNFGTDPGNVGTITSVSTAKVGTGTAVTSANQGLGADANVTFTVDYGFGPQQITLNLGQIGKSGGVTQFAGSEINVRELVQDGASRGQYKEVVYGDNGDVIVNYDNGRSRTIGRIPVVTFNSPNALQREAGGVYIETDEGGRPNFNDPDTNGAGAVVANSVESSNVDIADEFTKLIVTQRTYSANTKIVTTSDEMLQEVLGLKR
ncbi:flagellar hook-basal body complex protein [Azospirillum sp. YIM DDC1]|uniref:Flagellar hook protein FlgE n=1 Tax=Azospirillum aestuarii TaxID=2802052 RepID=A0ABS1I444_9PROT|nr:flagellar hook-basal body complex protein [Azospirillum aestuarii]MBK3774438.1 flagellar hook-basal body complex protein [Azospirillum brasilense]MBK4721835.1 flagellar hook-basal body complex protein [Azospirillum aestuarii]TWA85960.1 flagellar hook protein FlgE [Azospirillum brasilense]